MTIVPSLRPQFKEAVLASLLTLAIYFLFSHPAWAQLGGGLSGFSCSAGRASGTLYDSSEPCQTTLSMKHIFSFLVCNMERMTANLMGQMYCGILQTAIPAVNAALTLAVMIYGMAFTMGVIPATARDLQLFLLKMGLVWAFATQADYLIGIGYNLLITSMREGIIITLSGVYAGEEQQPITTSQQLYEYLDRFLAQMISLATTSAGISWDDPNQNPCKNAVFAVMAAMSFIFPPLFYVGVALLFKVGLTFVRAVFGYLYALMALVFFVTMAPLFLCFALFRQTTPLFNKYIGYCVSFSLQVIIVFAFLGAIVSMKVDHITSSFIDIIVPYKQENEAVAYRLPWQYCTVCDFQAVDRETLQPIEDYKNFISRGKLVCKQDKEGKPVTLITSMSPRDEEGGLTKEIRNSLLKFTTTALLSLVVLAYVVDALLRWAPALAQSLAGGLGAAFAPQIAGGGRGDSFASRPVVGMPGNDSIDALERGFADGYVNAMRDGKFTPNAVMQGFREGAVRMLFGDRARTPGIENRFSGNVNDDPGLVGNFISFIVRPE